MKTFFKLFFERLDFIFRNPNIRISFLCIFLLIIISTLLLSISLVGSSYEYKLGEIAQEEIRVPRDIVYILKSETEIKKKVASEAVPLVFDKDSSILVERLRIVQKLFININNTLKEFPLIGTDDSNYQLIELKKKLPKYLQYSDFILTEFIRYKRPDELRKQIYKILFRIYDHHDMGMLDKEYDNPLGLNNKEVVIRTIHSEDDSSNESDEISKSLKDLKTLDQMKKRVYGLCYSIAPNFPNKTILAMSRVVRINLRSNIKFNPEETKRRIIEGQKKVKPVTDTLKKGQTLIREGDTITIDILNKINILNKHTKSTNLGYIFGIILLQLVFLSIFGHFLIEYYHVLIPGIKSTIIISTLMGIFMIYTFLISKTNIGFESKLIFVFLLPIPFVTMMISILYNIYLSMLVGMHIVFFTTFIHNGDIMVAIIAFSLAIVGVFVNSNVEKRTDFLMGGLIIGAVNTVILISTALIEEIPMNNVLKISRFAIANGLFNSILALGILPIYENIFGITTRFKLLELSDLNADIFKKMLVKAPGTYNHSLIVSTMAEAACKDIRANSLLARVGSYYHDIGKIDDSGMYIENRITDPRAEVMSPLQYSQLIISHVKKGVDIARANNLPESVIDFIKEHHGKSIMTYFYHQALESAHEVEEHVEIERTDFQYPGPKPQSKETAVVMLADAIEAASRSLQDPTYVKLEGLVRKIIFNKLNEGELEYTDLSMTELNIIQKSFLRILNGIFHTRIEYPEAEDVQQLEEKVQAKDEEN